MLSRRLLTYGSAALLSVFATLLLTVMCHAIPIEMVGQWGGKCRAVAISGNRLYLGKGQQVLVFDVSTPVPSLLCKTQYLQGAVEDISLMGGYAYVACSKEDEGGGLLQLRLSDSPPTPTCYTDATRPLLGVCTANNVVYAAQGSIHAPRLTVFHVPAAGAFSSPGYWDTFNDPTLSVAVVGARVYITNLVRGMGISDIWNVESDSYSRSLLGRYDAFSWETPFTYPSSVAVAEPYAYIADSVSGIRILDVSSPSNPILKPGYSTTGDAQKLLLSSNRLYVANGDSGVQLLSTSNPLVPAKLGEYKPDDFAEGLIVSGNMAYVAGANPGLSVVDFSNPAVPTKTAGLIESGQAKDLCLRDHYAFVASGKAGLQVIDIADPANMARAGGANTDGTTAGICLSGNYAYLADSDKGLKILNIATPPSPAQVGSCAISHKTKDVVVCGNYAYVSYEDWTYANNAHYYMHGFNIINISQANAPVLAGERPESYRIRSMAISGNYLLLGEDNGLHVYDITSPGNPIQWPSYSLSSPVYDIAVSGNLAYLACGASGLQIMNIASLPSVTPVGSYTPSPSDARGICLNGNLAYVTNATQYSEGLQLVDVSNPSSPISAGSCTGLQTPSRVAAYGGYAIVANESAGLSAFRVGAYPAPTVSGVSPIMGTNTGVLHITNIAGTGFRAGATVKLTRASQSDIAASNVLVLSSTQISCDFHLTAKTPGLWNVVVTNPDGPQGSLPQVFAIVLPETSQVYGTSNGAAYASIMACVFTQSRFTFWGKVTNIDADSFWLDDGSKTPVRVFSPGHVALLDGNYATATGTFDFASSPQMLVSPSSGVRKVAP